MIGSTLIYMITVGLAQAMSLLLLPVVTRYLSPTAYGEYTLVLATTALMGTLGSAWIRNVAMRLHFDFAREGRSATLFATAALLQAGPLVGLMVVGYAWTQWISDPVAASTYIAGALTIVISDAYTLMANTLRAEQRASTFGAAEITSTLLRFGGTWVGLALGYRTPAMLFVFAAIAVLVAGVVAASGIRRCLSGPYAIDRATARELVRVGLPSVPQAVGHWLMMLSNRTFLAWYYGLDAVGIFSVAQGLGERAITGLTVGLSMMTWPAILRTWADRPGDAPRAIGRFLLIYVAVTLGPAVALVLYRETVVDVLVGPAYRDATQALPLVVAGTWLMGVAGYLNRPLELQKAYGTLSRITLAAAGVNVLLNLWLVPRYGIIGTAMSTAGTGLCLVVVSAAIVAMRRPLPLPWRHLAGVVALTFVATLLSSAVRDPFQAIAVFGVIYTPLAYVIGRQNLKNPRASSNHHD